MNFLRLFLRHSYKAHAKHRKLVLRMKQIHMWDYEIEGGIQRIGQYIDHEYKRYYI